MKLKTLLLSSAAAFAVVGGAQAADLSVAEPVEYVKACEAFGAGFYYIPGSDTCLHAFGHVEFDANFFATALTLGTSPSGHSASWDFTTSAEVEFDAKSMTDVGLLEGATGLKATYDPNASTNGDVVLDYAWLKLGALQAGHFGSTFNPGGSYVDDFAAANEIKSSLADSNHLQLTFKAASLAIALGIEDPRESFGSGLPATYSLPLIDGNITVSGSNWSGFLSAGYTQVRTTGPGAGGAGNSWGVDGELTFNVDANNHLIVNAAYGDNAYIGGGLPNAPFGFNNGWSAFASIRHNFSSTFRTDWDFSYLQPAGGGATKTNIGGDLVWLPYAGFRAKVGGFWTQTGTTNSWTAQVALRRDW